MSPMIPENIVHKKVGDETVLLNFDLGVYYGLDPVGTRVWELLAEGKTAAEIVEVMLGEYEIDRDTLSRDVDALLAELAARQLIV